MALTATQFNRNCQNFINVIEKTQQFQNVKQLLNQWKQRNKPAVGAIQTFMKIAKLLQDDEDLVEQFNKCLAKEASIPKKPCTNSEVKQLAMQNQKSGHLLDTVLNWIKADQKQKILLPLAPLLIVASTTIEQLTQQELTARLEAHMYAKSIARILTLYRKCIITLRQFKSLIQPIYLSDPSSFNMLFQYAQQLQTVRRKITIFAPLTDLVDEKYPVEQVGNSYIIIPDGYANYSHRWATNQCQMHLNRICCSVPLGSEGNFVISRKNQFQEQLFKNQQQKYQIDQTICTIKGAILMIQKNKNLNSPLIHKLLTKIYPYENVFNIMISQPQIAKNVILPRLHQKIEELYRCKQKFNKTCEDIAHKNYSKSLDYRCFYFRKNDKRFNSTQRWEKQIQLRKMQILQHLEEIQDQVNDRQALQNTRCYITNTFQNITKQQLLQDKKVDISLYDRKVNALYPSYPHNQILFIMSFQDQQVFNDVLEIILYHSHKKAILELIVLKLFKKIIQRRLIKDPSILAYIQSKASNNNLNNSHAHQYFGQNNENSNTNNMLFSGMNMGSKQPLNEPRKDRKAYKDITQQFHDFIQEQIQPVRLEQFQNPFQGPNQHTFISTKTIYNFLRYLLAIYQRFIKAKQLSDEKKHSCEEKRNSCEEKRHSCEEKRHSCEERKSAQQRKASPEGKRSSEAAQPSLYSQFLAVMIYKTKDPKQNFQESLRKLASQQAFIYFTLDKFIQSVTKLINNITSDSLTYKILKDQTKDYENQLKKWTDFNFPSITSQLTRVYRENQSLFRFTYTSTYFMHLSMWDNINPQKEKTKKQHQNSQNGIDDHTFNFMTQPTTRKKQNNQIKNNKKLILNNQNNIKFNPTSNLLINQSSEYSHLTEGVINMKGQFTSLRLKRDQVSGAKQINKQLQRLKKFIKRV